MGNCEQLFDLTRVYVADIGPLMEAEVYDFIYNQVSEDRRSKADRMRQKADKVRSVAAGLLLKKAYKLFIDEYRAGVSNGDKLLDTYFDKMPEVYLGDNGKPLFSDSPFFFNLSHSGDRVMCAISTKEVGCDVEYKSTNSGRIAKRFFAKEENTFIDESDDEAVFTKIWTLKESFLKAAGVGISYPMNSFSVIADGKIASQVIFADNQKEYFMKNFPSENGYAYSACSGGIVEDTEIIWIKLEDAE